MSRFKDKFAIISGGASGMGAATAKKDLLRKVDQL